MVSLGLPGASAGTIVLAAGLAAGLAAPSPCAAQVVGPREILDDAKFYFTAPLRWDAGDWLLFGGELIVVGTANRFDDDVRSHFAQDSTEALHAGNSHDARDALPAAALVAGTWAYAAWLGDSGGYTELGSMLESGVLTVASSELLKLSLGRERPRETTKVNSWFNGGDSFPSLHASAAFAIGTVFAESGSDDYRWARRALGYGVAGVTAYDRLHDNVHWLSDVVAGAVLGMASARFVMHRRDKSKMNSSVIVMPTREGLMLQVSVPLH